MHQDEVLFDQVLYRDQFGVYYVFLLHLEQFANEKKCREKTSEPEFYFCAPPVCFSLLSAVLRRDVVSTYSDLDYYLKLVCIYTKIVLLFDLQCPLPLTA